MNNSKGSDEIFNENKKKNNQFRQKQISVADAKNEFLFLLTNRQSHVQMINV